MFGEREKGGSARITSSKIVKIEKPTLWVFTLSRLSVGN